MRKNIYTEFMRSIGCGHPEKGGIIGADKNNIISAFSFDPHPKESSLHSYIPNVDYLNMIINSAWSANDIKFAGFVHSHINNDTISDEDIKYMRKILGVLKEYRYVHLGIVNVKSNTLKSDNAVWYTIEKINSYISKIIIV